MSQKTLKEEVLHATDPTQRLYCLEMIKMGEALIKGHTETLNLLNSVPVVTDFGIFARNNFIQSHLEEIDELRKMIGGK